MVAEFSSRSTVDPFDVHARVNRILPEGVAATFRILRQIEDWCRERPSRVSEAWLEWEGDGLGLHVVSTSEQFDYALNDELAELLIRLTPLMPIHGEIIPPIVAPDWTTFGRTGGIIRLQLGDYVAR